VKLLDLIEMFEILIIWGIDIHFCLIKYYFYTLKWIYFIFTTLMYLNFHLSNVTIFRKSSEKWANIQPFFSVPLLWIWLRESHLFEFLHIYFNIIDTLCTDIRKDFQNPGEPLVAHNFAKERVEGVQCLRNECQNSDYRRNVAK